MSVVQSDRFTQCKESIGWVAEHVDGLRLAEPCKRSHLAGACLHTAMEHGIAILVLIEDKLHGSALALVRLQLEAFVRGTWLAHAAGNDWVDKAGKDEFPKIGPMITALEKPGLLDSTVLSKIKGGAWDVLNSFTHTGYQQIGSRLGEAGIGSYFSDEEIRLALNWAESFTILAAVGVAGLAKNDQLMSALLERARSVAGS